MFRRPAKRATATTKVAAVVNVVAATTSCCTLFGPHFCCNCNCCCCSMGIVWSFHNQNESQINSCISNANLYVSTRRCHQNSNCFLTCPASKICALIEMSQNVHNVCCGPNNVAVVNGPRCTGKNTSIHYI